MKKILNYFVMGAVAVMFSAALASCQKESANEKTSTPEAPEVHVIHVELDATVADTKATYSTASKEITIQSGDALYVALTQPTSATWSGATGTLTYDGTSFKGDITYTGTYSGSDIITDAKDLTATFLPNGYSTVGYLSSTGVATAANAFYAGAKDAAVPQLVHLTATVSDQAGSAKTPLTLVPQNAVLCYSINANKLSAGAHTVSVSDETTTISGSVTAVADAATTFAVAFPAPATSKDYTLRVPAYENVVKSGKTLAAGKVINISIAAIAPTFSVSSTLAVKFSPGNLQAVFASAGTTCTWRFAEHQWDYVGDAAANTSIDGNGSVSAAGTVDLFGWSTSTTVLGINNSWDDGDYSGDFVDWGSNANVQAGIGTGWRTLTIAEWEYLLTRSITNRYCKATVNSKAGLVLFPDSYTHPSGPAAIASANTSKAAFTTNTWSADDWIKMETAGAVFLPAAEERWGGSVSIDGTNHHGNYWSSTPNSSGRAFPLQFSGSDVSTDFNYGAVSNGYSVRLVQNQ